MDDQFFNDPRNESFFYNSETNTYFYPKDYRVEVIKRCKLILEHRDLLGGGVCSLLTFRTQSHFARELCYKFPYYFRLDTWGQHCLIEYSEYYQGAYFGKTPQMNPLRECLLEFIIRTCMTTSDFEDYIQFCNFFCKSKFAEGNFPCVFQKDYPQ